MDTFLAICIGLGLSAACGFRVFVPLLGLSLGSMFGVVLLSPDFVWLGSWIAVLLLSVATLVEVGAYYIPWLDNFLDTIATPLAIAAGGGLLFALTGELPEVMRWGIATIAGGGSAGIVQGGSVLLRAASSATTGGVGNPAVSTGELIGSIIGTLMAILLPMLAALLSLLLCGFVLNKIIQKMQRPKATETT